MTAIVQGSLNSEIAMQPGSLATREQDCWAALQLGSKTAMQQGCQEPCRLVVMLCSFCSVDLSDSYNSENAEDM
jgi:hypothetical protein